MTELTDLQKTILKFSLKNALDFKGSVNPKVVLGMTLRESLEYKKDVPNVMKEINATIQSVKDMSAEEIKSKLEEIAPELLQEKKVEKIKGPLKELPNAEKGKVVVRIAPSPSGPLHIGHAYGASLNAEYAKMYEGKFIVRIEDTNPANIYPKAYEMIEEDAKWLTDGRVNQVVVQSDRIETYHRLARQLVEKGQAYVCLLDADTWREMKAKGEPSPYREHDVTQQMERFEKMFTSYREGEAVLRLKTDMQHKNPAMRDFSLMRISEHAHPRTGTKHKVWPLMVLSVAIDDHELGITHVLNGKDHMDNAAKERMIMDCFGWKHPEYRHWGIINFIGYDLSTTKTKLAIEQKEYNGWDDIRIPFLPALRKRGYVAAAFRKFAIEIGLSMNDKKVTMEEFWKMVNAFNKEIVEKSADRYFFVEDPEKMEVKGMQSKKVVLKKHPEMPEKGVRELEVSELFYLAKRDVDELLEGHVHRLMDCCNAIMNKGMLERIEGGHEEFKKSEKKGKIIHWLPVGKVVRVEVVGIDGKRVEGYGEAELASLDVGTTVQFERFAFCTLEEKKEDRLIFWMLHR